MNDLCKQEKDVADSGASEEVDATKEWIRIQFDRIHLGVTIAMVVVTANTIWTLVPREWLHWFLGVPM